MRSSEINTVCWVDALNQDTRFSNDPWIPICTGARAGIFAERKRPVPDFITQPPCFNMQI